MAAEQSCPAVSDLKRLLHGELPEPELSDISRHLEMCPSCQQQLHELAAGGRSWEALAEHLKSGTAGRGEALAQAMAKLRDSKPGRPTQDESEEGEEISLEFFDPPIKPRQLGKLDHYEIIEAIGRGGMGLVFKALDPGLHRIVAIKVMAPQLAAVPSARQRFVREARAAAAVCHEHVVTIHAVAEFKGLPYLVMQLVAGVSLQDRVEQRGPLSLDAILRIGMQTAQGLAAAHAQGLVHRDIKPANILLENGVERVKITDFGLARVANDARITQSGVIVGTPQYMAPEQARGESADPRADLFSLGSVLYFMCTGQAPFQGDSSLAVLRRVCDETPPPIREVNPDAPAWLVEIIARLQAKKPDDRYQTALEVAELLNQQLMQLQSPRSASPLPEPMIIPIADAEWFPFESRKNLWWKWLALFGAACVLALLLSLSLPRSPTGPREETGRAAERPDVRSHAERGNEGSAAPLIAAPRLTESKVEVRLSEPFAQVRTGGGGRYLVFHLKKAKKLAVFDVEAVKVVAEIELPTEDVVYACGQDKLMMVFPGQKIIQRRNLRTFQREKTASVPDDRPVLCAAMGCHSQGPLLLWTGGEVIFFDVERMEPLAVEGEILKGGTQAGLELRVSADGRTFVGWAPKVSPMNYNVMRLTGRKVETKRSPDAHSFNGHWAMPGADASLLFRHGAGIYSSEMKILAADGFRNTVLLPSEDPRFFLALRQQTKDKDQAVICTTADRRTLLALSNLEKMTGARSYTNWGLIGGEPRIHYLPSANVLLTLPESNDRIVVRPFDLFATLDKERRNYLFVLSVPRTRVRSGTEYVHALDIRSKAGGIRCKLEAGPEGMTVSPDGRLHWQVPTRQEDMTANAIVTIGDASGKEIQHSFEIVVE